MSDGRETVVFGPFIGEFGWELLYWHGQLGLFVITSSETTCGLPCRSLDVNASILT